MSATEPIAPPITADQLLGISQQLKNHGRSCELVAGELRIMSPSGGEHGRLSVRIGGLLDQHVLKNDLGVCFGAETGFLIHRDPDTVKAPDAAFVRKERAVEVGVTKKYFPEVPALAVEVVSPSDKAEEVQAKARMWIEAGCEAVWLVWPEGQTVTDYRSLDNIRVLTADQMLDGGDVVPGFSVQVAELFVGLNR